jgi:hypothetical protein
MAAPGFTWLGEYWESLPEGKWIAAGENGEPLIYGESFEHLADQLANQAID